MLDARFFRDYDAVDGCLHGMFLVDRFNWKGGESSTRKCTALFFEVNPSDYSSRPSQGLSASNPANNLT